MNIITRILETKVNHQGNELDAYIPQIQIEEDVWQNLLGENGYILAKGHNPVEVCTNCSGQGCKECNQRGTKKGESKNQYEIAKFFVDNAVTKIKNSIDFLGKFTTINGNYFSN